MMQLKPACEDLYHDMVSEVYASRHPDLSPANLITYCFTVCMDYWNRLKDLVRSYQFENDEEEIWFFKILKPKFTSLLEYYKLVNHTELFMPATKDENVQFLKKEQEKVKKFYSQYQEFCQYYKSGGTNMDHIYFLRKNAGDCKDCRNPLYDTDDDLITSHGHLVSSLLAFDMYDAYIAQQLKKADDHISP